ncbi:MAG: LPS export ABC transporter periplasmic protein LptC [FCB group bacterium]|nr:LPS export ABC transporter periplasmic protein LptC [FCB group bacterium]
MVQLACGSSDPVDLDSDEEQTQIVTDFTFVQSSGGERSWILESDWAHYTEGDSVLLLPGVEVTFFESDVPETSLLGDSGRIEIQDGLMRVWGNVRIETEGRSLVAPEIEWREETEMFCSDCLVVLTVTTDSSIAGYQGVGIDLNINLDVVDNLEIRDAFHAEYSKTDDSR